MNKFKKIYIEITNVCNLSCEFCPTTKREPLFMDKSFFENILLGIKDYGNHIYLHVKGEPLLHKDIDIFLDIAYKHNLKVNLTTNGTLISKVQEKIINKPALRQVNFSLHSFDANIKTVQIEQYLQNIFEFINKASLNGNIISALRLWNLSENNTDNLNLNRNGLILKAIEKQFNLKFELKDELSKVRGIKLCENVYLNQASRFKWPGDYEAMSTNTGFCHGLRDQIAILSDGTVVPCCLDGEGVISLGNIKENSFSEIINSRRANAIYDGFSKRIVVEELCKNCDYRIRFNK